MKAADSSDLRPVDPATRQARPQMEQPGYYPGFRTLGQQNFWDEATRRKVLDRVHKIPALRFFNPEEARLLETIAGHLLPQDDRFPARQIPMRSATRTRRN